MYAVGRGTLVTRNELRKGGFRIVSFPGTLCVPNFGINLLSIKLLSSRAADSGVLFRARATLFDAENRVMGYSPQFRHRGDLYPLICSIVSGDTREQLQIEDAKTVEEFQANNSHLGDQPERNLAQAVEGSDMNYGRVGLLSDTTGKLPPSLKRKHPSCWGVTCRAVIAGDMTMASSTYW